MMEKTKNVEIKYANLYLFLIPHMSAIFAWAASKADSSLNLNIFVGPAFRIASTKAIISFELMKRKSATALITKNVALGHRKVATTNLFAHRN
jgi:hypothetical protein